MAKQPLRGLRLKIPRGLLSRRALQVGAILTVLVVLAGFWILRPFWVLSGQFADHPLRQPSRLYAASMELVVGERLPASAVTRELRDAGYREASPAENLAPGLYRATEGGLEVHLRGFATPAGFRRPGRLEVTYRGDRIRALNDGGEPVETALLHPPVLASFYGPDMQERRPVLLDEVPDHVIQAVLAAEDDRFFKHAGVSIRGVLRALWTNLKGDGVLQGGSTLTQQLAKNLYLSHERSLTRKIPEGILALLLETRYTKEQILQAYLNEIYLGSSNGVNLIGIGAASRAYFGKEAMELSLGEAATIAGMIPSPARYSPVGNPDTAVERRRLVLERLRQLEWIDPGAIDAALATALETHAQRPVKRKAPFFVDLARQEVTQRFGVESLGDAGYTVLSTLRWNDQRRAAEAILWGLPELEKGWEKGSKATVPLETAVVSLDPRTGGVLAYLGGRSYNRSQFDRASQARRQAGSAFKPVVFASALERGLVAPSTLIEDEPLTVRLASQTWSPQNDDDSFRGLVSVRTAMEKSLNVPTARLALAAGLPEIVDMSRRLGVQARLEPYPSIALGAFELTPVELATVYGTLASGGMRPAVHGVTAVFDRSRAKVLGERLPEPERALSAQTAYLLTSVLQGVLDRGTARRVREAGLPDALAGKTGTSNSRRDSWFAGYSPDRTTVVWVGYDDNSSTRLSGTRAALPIWARFVRAVRPAGGYPSFRQPSGVVTALIDPTSGNLATEDCPDVLTEVFREGEEPRRVCPIHGPWWRGDARYRDRDGELDEPRTRRRSFRRWLDRVFGGGNDDDADDRRGANGPPPRDGEGESR